MISVKNKEPLIYYGSKTIKEVYKGSTKIYPSIDLQAIMDSLVCWYDPGKQQCTNESMAVNPVLTDLSGNGHDIECFNFGWSGMSGIGGYNWTYNNFSTKTNFEHTDESVTLVNSDKSTFETIYDMSNVSNTFNIVKGQKIKVSGITGNVKIVAYVQASDSEFHPLAKNTVIITENGEYDIADLDLTEIENVAYTYQGFKEISIPEGVTVKIENIPLYPNALVSDGVDDCCYTDGLPILTDYTVIAKRKWLQTEGSNNDNFAAKGNISGSFLIESYGNNGNQECYSFGQYNGVSFVQEDVIYQTKESYNGYPLKVGTATDVDNLVILGRNSAPLGCIQAALYSFLLFDRTLTTAEIEWVKKNMVEGDLVLPSYELDPSLIDAWIFSGLRNEDAPASIVGEKGIELYCHNFAWNKEGSGFKDGALWFDGVDDYLINEEMPLLTDFTVITRRKCFGDAGALAYKGKGKDFNLDGSGAFRIETIYNGGSDIRGKSFDTVYSVSNHGPITKNDEAVSFTPTSAYKGLEYEQNFESVPREDGPVLKINSPLYANNYYTITMKYFAIYNKTLSDEEIKIETKKLEVIWSNRKNN